MRTLVIGDIHGGLRALIQVLNRAKVSVSDNLIFMGDYVDGWSESPQLLDFLIELENQQNCIFIRGNHDQLFLDWLVGRHENIDEKLWFIHGGKATVDAYKLVTTETVKQHIAFLEKLNNYHKDSKNRLFVHAGFTHEKGIEHEENQKNYYWDRTLWTNSLELDKNLKPTDIGYPKQLLLYDEIYIGHNPVTRIGKTTPVQLSSIWNVDTGAAFTGPLTIMDIDTKEFWQSDPLPELYPDEKGRN